MHSPLTSGRRLNCSMIHTCSSFTTWLTFRDQDFKGLPDEVISLSSQLAVFCNTLKKIVKKKMDKLLHELKLNVITAVCTLI